jgi:hypothetical protein
MPELPGGPNPKCDSSLLSDLIKQQAPVNFSFAYSDLPSLFL